MAGLTIGITTARFPDCKRGVAVNVAAALARTPGAGEVCVVDGDPLVRDVTTRLPVRGPMVEDYAADRSGFTAPARLPSSPLAVIGSAGEGLGRVRRGMDVALPVLAEAFAVVVCDLVGGAGGPERVVGDRLAPLDWLLLAVTPDPDHLAPARHFVEHLETARARGALAPSLRFALVCTGDEGTSCRTAAEVEAAVGAPVAATIPQLWGRAEPNLGFGAALAIPELDEAVAGLHARVAPAVARSTRD